MTIIRSMSDLDITFKEAIVAWERDNNRAPLEALRAQYGELLNSDAYDLAFEELKAEGEL